MECRRWTSEEIAILKEKFPELGMAQFLEARLLDRSRNAIQNKARRLMLRGRCKDCERETCPEAIYCGRCSMIMKRERGDFNEQPQKMRLAWKRGDFEGHAEKIRLLWKRGILGDEQWRHKVSQHMKRRWRKGDFDNHARVMQAAWERGCFDNKFQSPTNIEIEIGDALDAMGIEHTPQYRPEGYGRIYDEFIYPNILLEIQGDYFHSEKHFPGIRERDAEKARWAKENGYIFIEIWEHEIKKHGALSIITEGLELKGQSNGQQK